jgi:hypothetical protein
MITTQRFLMVVVAGMLLGSFLNAQQSDSQLSAGVPRLVNFSARAVDAQGKTITGIAGVTFAIYADQSNGAPLWMETQNVQADTKGNYIVQLGSTKPEGLPLDLFTSGGARWLEVTINGGQEQPRILLLSVPYALKAADAETVGGLPASAFVLANRSQENRSAAQTSPTSNVTRNTPPPPVNPAVTGKGATGFVPVWDSASDIIDSVVSQKNSLIGINTATPAARLDVNGKSDVRDTLTLFPRGTDPTLAVNGTKFRVASTGEITFASGQTFPGTAQLVANNAFTGDQLISGDGAFYGLTVSSPNYLALDLQAPEAGVGTGIEIATTGTSGMSWQILNTGSGAPQGANKLNFRNDSAGIDVMTMTATGDVIMSGNALQHRTSGGMVKAMLHFSPFNGGRIISCFNSNLSGAAATTPPCGFVFDITGAGDYIFDFGFEVDDRFYSATPGTQFSGVQVGLSACGNQDGQCLHTGSLTNNQVEVTSIFNGFVDSKIHLIVY